MNSEMQTALTETGTVVAVDNDYASVATERSSGCSGCKTNSCGSPALASLFTQSAKPITVKNSLNCKVGDRVELKLDESQLLKHSFMAYGLPLVGLFIGAIVLSNLMAQIIELTAAQTDLLAVIGALLGLFAGWWLTKKNYQPVLPEINKIL